MNVGREGQKDGWLVGWMERERDGWFDGWWVGGKDGWLKGEKMADGRGRGGTVGWKDGRLDGWQGAGGRYGWLERETERRAYEWWEGRMERPEVGGMDGW
jgi:hypothetical protein